jgi:glycosyltransferase involved in cell wall biosynthesis
MPVRFGPTRGRWALDTSLARAGMTGIGLYTRELARALAAGSRRERLVFFGGEHAALPGGIPWRRPETSSRTLWMLGQVPDDLSKVGAGLFHAVANFNLPLRRPQGVGLCLTVHDLIPLTHPGSVSLPYRLQFGAWLSRSLDLADAIICVSEATRSELWSRFPGVVAGVIHHGVDHLRARPHEVHRARGKARPYLLYLGSLEARKNVGVLLTAYERLGDRSLGLTLAGSTGFGAAEILDQVARLRRAGFEVRQIGPVGRAGLPELIREAELLCAPSSAEGFSLPPLEAMALGTPVVASAIAAHTEILGEAARLIPVGDAEALVSELRRVLDDTDLRATLRRAGLVRSKQYTWARAAQQTEDVYASLCP